MENLKSKETIDTIGNCANCGVEFHIHKENSDQPIIKNTATEKFEERQSLISNEELILLARAEVSKLCKTGGKSLKMCVPPSIKDTDMLLCEVIKRLEDFTKNLPA